MNIKELNEKLTKLLINEVSDEVKQNSLTKATSERDAAFDEFLNNPIVKAYRQLVPILQSKKAEKYSTVFIFDGKPVYSKTTLEGDFYLNQHPGSIGHWYGFESDVVAKFNINEEKIRAWSATQNYILIPKKYASTRECSDYAIEQIKKLSKIDKRAKWEVEEAIDYAGTLRGSGHFWWDPTIYEPEYKIIKDTLAKIPVVDLSSYDKETEEYTKVMNSMKAVLTEENINNLKDIIKRYRTAAAHAENLDDLANHTSKRDIQRRRTERGTYIVDLVDNIHSVFNSSEALKPYLSDITWAGNDRHICIFKVDEHYQVKLVINELKPKGKCKFYYALRVPQEQIEKIKQQTSIYFDKDGNSRYYYMDASDNGSIEERVEEFAKLCNVADKLYLEN
jgi:hypothetical protein